MHYGFRACLVFVDDMVARQCPRVVVDRTQHQVIVATSFGIPFTKDTRCLQCIAESLVSNKTTNREHCKERRDDDGRATSSQPLRNYRTTACPISNPNHLLDKCGPKTQPPCACKSPCRYAIPKAAASPTEQATPPFPISINPAILLQKPFPDTTIS
jgi:hypothetical protein